MRGRRLFRRVTATLAVLGLAFVALVSVPTAAQAATNTAIVVGSVTIAPADKQPTIGDVLTVSGSWDAREAAPNAGDVFTVALPPEFAFAQAVPFQLMGSDAQGNPVVWGNCLTDPATGVATCELTDAVTATPEVVTGTWQFQVEAVQSTTAEEVLFDLNGTPLLVDLPGVGGIDDGIDLPGEVTKSGVMNQNNWSMTWTVDVPGANMAGQNTVTLRDTLGAGHQLCSPTGLKVETVRGSSVNDVTSLVTTAPEAGETAFTIGLTAPAGGFDPNVTYRVTYQTCTPDGQIDPEGTLYDNSAQIEGWGDAGTGIGQVENRPWQVAVGKSGNVLGGADRNGKVAWNVAIPGDKLVGKNSFTLTEALGAGHQLCGDTIQNLRITERYGPSDQLTRDVTGLHNIVTLSASDQAFQLRFDITDPAFAFKASDYRYEITYTTCVTSDVLPDEGTGYANSANVDGDFAVSEPTVADRNKGKSGRINTSTVTIDGVQHMPQTTLDWSIVIPGTMIEDINDVLTLTDTFSGSQTVCEAGDPSAGLAARLRLNVEARDQINNGGLASVNLNASTAVSAEDSTLTFAIDSTDLPIPTGTSDGFSREYQYVVSYTTCTTSGGMDAPGTEYGNTVVGSGIDFTSTTTQNNSGSGTGQGVTRGTVAINKLLADTPGAALVPADTTFTVHVREIDPTGGVAREYDLAVPINGAPVSGLNARGTGWTVELTEPTFPAISGVTFGAPVFSAGPGVTVSADGSTATASVIPGTNVSVSLTNEALLGSVSILKTLSGSDINRVASDRTYEVTAAFDTSALGKNVPAQVNRVLEVTAGVPLVLGNLPIGATVSFTEARPADDDTLTWAAPVITPASLVITPDLATEPAVISVVNGVSRTVGTFSIVKTVTGEQAGNAAVPAAVEITASWDQEGTPGSKTLSVPTDGTPVPFDEQLLIGTAVTLTETPLADGSSIAWGAPVWSGTGVAVDGLSAVVTIGRDAAATVNLENHAATSIAGISLIKGIAGEAADEVDPSTEFPVVATWTDAAGEPQSRELTINALEPTLLGVDLPAGTVVTLTEGTRPAIDTVVWTSITIAGSGVTDTGDGSATVVVSDQQRDVSLVTVINEATWAPGTFSLTKSIVGVLLEDAEVPESVTVLASWIGEGEQQAEISVPTDGTVVEFPQQLPHGTEVTLTEVESDDTARFTWAAPQWSGDRVAVSEEGTMVVTIGAADVAEVALVNTAVPTLGSLSLTKTLTGDGASASAATAFPVKLTWIDLLGEEQTRSVELVAGRAEVLDGLPLGTELHVEEQSAKLADRITWVGADWSSTSGDDVSVSTDRGSASAVITVTGEAGVAASVALQNTLAVVPALAITGVEAGSMLAIAAGALIALLAGGLLIRARRQTRA